MKYARPMLCTRPTCAKASQWGECSSPVSRAEACVMLLKARELALTSAKPPFIKRCGPGIWYISTRMGAVHLYTRGWK